MKGLGSGFWDEGSAWLVLGFGVLRRELRGTCPCTNG